MPDAHPLTVDQPPTRPARLPDLVTDAVADVLNLPAGTVSAAPSLFDLPGFDSLAIVAVLDRLETRLAVEVPADRILPEAFGSVDALCDLLAGATPTSPSDAGGPR